MNPPKTVIQKVAPCWCGAPMQVKTWRDYHTREVIAVVDWCPKCHSSRPHRESVVGESEGVKRGR